MFAMRPADPTVRLTKEHEQAVHSALYTTCRMAAHSLIDVDLNCLTATAENGRQNLPFRAARSRVVEREQEAEAPSPMEEADDDDDEYNYLADRSRLRTHAARKHRRARAEGYCTCDVHTNVRISGTVPLKQACMCFSSHTWAGSDVHLKRSVLIRAVASQSCVSILTTLLAVAGEWQEEFEEGPGAHIPMDEARAPCTQSFVSLA
eukprot:3890087-Pleurochrysis_carterae.AAC.1